MGLAAYRTVSINNALLRKKKKKDKGCWSILDRPLIQSKAQNKGPCKCQLERLHLDEHKHICHVYLVRSLALLLAHTILTTASLALVVVLLDDISIISAQT